MSLPPELLEATNGVLTVSLLWVTLGLLYYLNWKRRDFASFFKFYHECKAAVALLLTFSSLLVRTADIWVARHLQNTSLPPPPWAHWSPLIHVASTAAAAIGVMCWLRVTIPGVCGPRLWAVLTALAFVIGIGAAL